MQCAACLEESEAPADKETRRFLPQHSRLLTDPGMQFRIKIGIALEPGPGQYLHPEKP